MRVAYISVVETSPGVFRVYTIKEHIDLYPYGSEREENGVYVKASEKEDVYNTVLELLKWVFRDGGRG